MQKELKYNGYAAVPSDYECQDGDLAAVLGLIPDKGALHPVAEPVNVLQYSGTILFVHETAKFKHYIGMRRYVAEVDEETRYYQVLEWKEEDSVSSHSVKSWYNYQGYDELPTIYQVNAVGNTLVVLTSSGMLYFLWKGDTSSYLELGAHIPELPISFGLRGTYVASDEYSHVELQHPLPLSTHYELDDEDVPAATNMVLGQANKFIAKYATNEGRFVQPFFVRYAFRLFDGSLVMHSAPVLMMAASKASPIVLGDVFQADAGRATSLQACAHGMVYDLDYSVLDSGLLEQLRRWSDIVKSVDIFVSAPLYKYKQDGENVKEIVTETDKEWWYSVCKLMNWKDRYDSVPKRYQKLPLYYAETWSENSDNRYPMKHWILPEFSDGEYNEKVEGCSSFYLLSSIPLDNLSTSITKVEVSSEYLQSLVNREAMDDDYDSHTSLLPRFSYPYNSRLNLCDITKTLFPGFRSGAAVQRTDGYVGPTSGSNDAPSTANDRTETLRVYVYLKKDGKTVIVTDNYASTHAFNAPISYYYYPDPDAFKAVFRFISQSSESGTYSVELKPHTGLNGAYFYAGGQSVKDVGASVSVPTASSDLTVEIRNKIYTSEINNPFLFPLLGINTVGNGRIMAIASAAKALSQGQFGQFPMYAFSTDGVWALEVSATTGAFSGRQPITRDVCLSADSIGQIDSAVLFASDRGIMLLSGSVAQCITEGIDNNGEPFNFAAMPLANDIKTLLGITAGGNDALTEKPFKTFLAGCRILYAYNRQHIIVFNPSFSYAYVYSLESKQWGIIKSSISARVNSYPQAYAMSHASGVNMLVDFSQENGVSGKQFLMTRPLKLDSGAKDVLKTIDTIIQRGEFTKGHVQVILYGSRDLQNWFTIYSSQDHYLRGFRGTPYKYFRIALVCSLTHSESVWGATIQYTPRLTDQPR